jgi:hypothetical protein
MFQARPGALWRGLVGVATGGRAAGWRVALRGFAAASRRALLPGPGALRGAGCGGGGADFALKVLSGSCITLRTTQ